MSDENEIGELRLNPETNDLRIYPMTPEPTQAIAAFKERLRQKVGDDLTERIKERDEATDKHTRTVLNGEIIALKDVLNLIKETH